MIPCCSILNIYANDAYTFSLYLHLLILIQDHPGLPGKPSPFLNMKTAVTRTTRDDPNIVYGPEYRVSVHEALKAYTINAAWQLRVDDKIGSIKAGKKADLVVLSENPYRVDPFDLERIRAIETFMDGRRTNFASQ